MIIPVFDVKDGYFVCGKSGKRDTYCKLGSVYGDSPLDIAVNLMNDGARYVYIADLDRIEGVGDNSSFISEINSIVPVLLDNGANCVDDIVSNRDICTYSILATESMTNIDAAYAVFDELPFETVIVSVDIKDNELLTGNKDIRLDDVISMINTVKPAYTIVLNISRVGTGNGNVDVIVRDIIDSTPYTQHIVAGGLTNESIRDYKDKGIDNFLVGSILHDGTLLDEYKW